MAAAGDILVRTLELVARKIRPGVTTKELDKAAEKFIRSQGATPAFKGYRGFPGSLCTSPNSMVVHGIPGSYSLAKGDILSVDCGVVLDGWVADAARTFAVGPISPTARKLLDTTQASLLAAVAAVPRRQPPRRRLARRSGGRRGRRAIGRALARRARHRPRHARGPADPQLRARRQGRQARGGDGVRGRADGDDGAPCGPARRGPLVDLFAGRIARRALRVHDRDHRRRAADPDAVARTATSAAALLPSLVALAAGCLLSCARFLTSARRGS